MGYGVCRVWCKVDTQPSQALLAAQEKLLALRQQVHIYREPVESPIKDQLGKTSPPMTIWPTHLGWHSESLSRLGQQPQAGKPVFVENAFFMGTAAAEFPPASTPPATLTLSPDLALAILNHNRVAESRIWFLLRHLDEAGRGWLEMAQVRRSLCDATSVWRLCGWRQLRILLGQGEGLFWQKQGDRLWLRSVVKVAAALGLTHLSGYPIILPLLTLTRPIGEVKAHFYASFHSGRNHPHQPIARATLSHLSGVSHQTQRSYEKRVGVRPQTNFALGEIATPETQEECAWQRGSGMFTFTDYNGEQGQAHTTYLAWQLPNDYTGPHQPQPKRHQKRLNRRLADLRQQGTAGNGPRHKRFFAQGAEAVTKQKGEEVYWRGRGKRGQGQIWYLLSKSDW